MFQALHLSTNHWLPQVWLAQAPLAIPAAETTPVLFSGPQFFVTLISGILLTFGLQLLLTNFSVAAGISYLGRSSSSHDADDDEEGLSIRKIGFGLGIWTLITVTIALFLACYLAVQLSLLANARLGAIIGLVIWAAYFSLLVWVSSSKVGSLIGSVVSTATSGFQAIFGAATAAIGGKVAQQQVVSTAEAVMAAVRNELGSAIDPSSLRTSVEDYVKKLQLPNLDLSGLRQDFEALLNDPEVAELAKNDRFRNIDRRTFIDLVSKRTDFSQADVERIADLLEGVWKQTLGARSRRDSTAELIDYLRSTEPGKLQINELNAKLDRLLAERSQQSTNQGEAQAPGVVQQTLQSGVNTLIGLLVGRTDLSDINLEKIVGQLKSVGAKIAEPTSKAAAQLGVNLPSLPAAESGNNHASAYSPIRQDVENYLTTHYSWQMTPGVLDREFREVLYDPNADPGAIAQQLSSLNRSYFTKLLSSRGVFTQTKIQEIAGQLEAIRADVLARAVAAKESEIVTDLRQRVQIYLTVTPKEQLFSEDTLPAFKALLSDDQADHSTLTNRLSAYDRATLQSILAQRTDLLPEKTDSILNALERTRDRVLFDSQSLDEQAKQKFTEAQQRLQERLRSTGKAELNPEGIKRDFQLLLNDPQLGLQALRNRASMVDRDTLVQLLSQRDDISQTEANEIVDNIESTWLGFVHAPQNLADAAKDKYDQTTTAIADYLRRTNLEELDPDGIQRDLKTLLDDPKEGALALRDRLSKVDRETLVRLLSQREDLSEEQVNQTIDQVQEAIRDLIRAPRRLARRTQQTIVEFETTLEDYLRNTNKEELNPEGIKRDLSLLVQHPKYGLENLSERFSKFDRSTLIALLSQREDMSEEEADLIVTQIESVRDQVLDQIQQVQYRIQEIIDRLFGRIRNYLNSLDRPELNYDSIKSDIRTLFDDPQAGFEALQNRLSQFDRGTLVAVLSSRKDISEADANRIIDQIESARMSVLHQAERIQTETQRRLEDVKRQAQRQVEETRKAAASAAWWLFLTALVSALAAAGAGALAAS